MQEISSQLFDYDAETRTFTADISELEAVHGQVGVVFYMRSARTGAMVEFEYILANRDDEEGEVQSWYFTSEYLPSINGHLRVIIFND
jgi:hypothetical protein